MGQPSPGFVSFSRSKFRGLRWWRHRLKAKTVLYRPVEFGNEENSVQLSLAEHFPIESIPQQPDKREGGRGKRPQFWESLRWKHHGSSDGLVIISVCPYRLFWGCSGSCVTSFSTKDSILINGFTIVMGPTPDCNLRYTKHSCKIYCIPSSSKACFFNTQHFYLSIYNYKYF